MAIVHTRNVRNRKKGSKSIEKYINLAVSTIKKSVSSPSDLISFISDLLFNPSYSIYAMFALLPLELILNFLIIYKIPYTEIDWVAYMQEVEGFLNGTFNYYELKGDTGPLVYPAGFVYVYSFFYFITNQGANIKLAQFVFVFIYLAFISVVFSIYYKSKRVPPIALIIMCLTSHRIHSIFVLRLFNDPIAMFFLYLSVLCILLKFWRVGCILFSFAVSIKMNVILFAPGLFVVLVLSHGFLNSFQYIFLCALVQLILGSPFLFTFPIAYIHRSFDLGRQFIYYWTVNWKFLPENLFHSRYFHLALLAAHLLVLVLFLNRMLKIRGGLMSLISHSKAIKLSNDFVISVMFISNYIGICFSRSLHYQFYVWYYHTFPFILWSSKLPNPLRFLIFGLVELSWNIFPSNAFSSITLNVCNLIVLGGLWRAVSETKNRLGFE